MGSRNIAVHLRVDRTIGRLLLAAAVVSGGVAASQTLTLTTSYPVPSGIYNQLITTGNSGSAPANTTLNRNAGSTILVPPTNTDPNGAKVGIGTTNPGRPLDVAGAGIFTSPNGGSAGGVIIRDAAGNPNAAYLQFVNNADSGQYGAIQGLAAGGLSLSGDVGIGVTNPNWPLTVGGGGQGNAFGVSESGDIIVTGGSDKLWALYDGNLNPILDWDDNIMHMGIAGSSELAYTLRIYGSIGYNGGGNISDVRYKKNIKPIPDALAKVLNLQGVAFDWKREEYPKQQFKNGGDIGLIAQDVEKVVPEVVITDGQGYKAIEYGNLSALLIEGMKQQQKLLREKDLEIQGLQTQAAKIPELEAGQAAKSREIAELRAAICEVNPTAKVCK